MTEEQKDWHPFNFYNHDELRPAPGTICEVKTEFGIRIAEYKPPKSRSMLWWMAKDCTHPMQNCNLNTHVTEWRPLEFEREYGQIRKLQTSKQS